MGCYKIKGSDRFYSKETIQAELGGIIDKLQSKGKRNIKQLNNRLLEMYIAVLTAPKNYDGVMGSIDDNYMKDEVERLQKIITKSSDESTRVKDGLNFVTPQHQTDTRIEYRDPKKSIALQANVISDININKNAHIELKSPALIISDENGKVVHEFNTWDRDQEIVIFDRDPNSSKILSSKDISEVKGGTHDRIIPKSMSTIHSVLQNAFLDAASDPFISTANFNPNTFNVASFLTRLGVQYDVVIAFMMNPIIKEWGSATSFDTSLYQEYVDKKKLFIESINDEYGIDLGTVDDLKDSSINNENNAISNSGLSGLRDMLANPKDITKGTIIELINTYDYINLLARDASPAQKVNDVSTKGAGKGTVEMMARDKVTAVAFDSDKSIFKSIDKKVVVNGQSTSIGTASKLSDTVAPTLANFSHVFTKEFQAKIDKIVGGVGFSAAAIKESERVARGLNSYLYLNKFNSILSQKVKGNPMHIFKPGPKSMGKYLIKLQKDSRFEHNKFVQGLSTKLIEGYQFIEFKADGLNKADKTKLQEDYTELAAIEPVFSELLTAMNLLTTGFNQTRNSLNDIMPDQYMLKAFMSGEFTNISNTASSDEFVADDFIDTAVQLNYMDFKKVTGKYHVLNKDNVEKTLKNSVLSNLVKKGIIVVGSGKSKLPTTVHKITRRENEYIKDYFVKVGDYIVDANTEDSVTLPIYLRQEKLGFSKGGKYIYEMDENLNRDMENNEIAISNISQNFLSSNPKRRKEMLKEIGDAKNAVALEIAAMDTEPTESAVNEDKCE